SSASIIFAHEFNRCRYIFGSLFNVFLVWSHNYHSYLVFNTLDFFPFKTDYLDVHIILMFATICVDIVFWLLRVVIAHTAIQIC
ncbi:hypothetical protein ACJX0J_008188, partial [Zea mays]